MKKLGRISLIVLVVLMAISVVMLVSLVANVSSVSTDPKMNAWIDYNLTWAYILLVVAACAALLFAAYQMVTDFKAAKGVFGSLGFMLLVVVIAYLLSSNELPQFLGAQKFIDEGILTPNVSKFVDTGLITAYFLLGIAVLSLLVGPISKLFDR